MIGREDRKENDLFFTCSLIEYIGRKTKNRRSVVVNSLGRKYLEKIYELADVYHSDNIENVSDDFIEKTSLTDGDFDNVAAARYAVPSYWDMGKVYKRLILSAAKELNTDIITALTDVYNNSFICDKIDNYNSSFYYDNPQNILNAYLTGIIE